MALCVGAQSWRFTLLTQASWRFTLKTQVWAFDLTLLLRLLPAALFALTQLCIPWAMYMVGGALRAPCDPLYIAYNPFNCLSLGRHALIFGITWSKLVLLLGLVLY